jgi:hypothetical protein
MRNGGKKAEPYGPAYLDLIRLRTDDLRDTANRTLQMPNIEESERDNLNLALKSLDLIDELVKVIRKRPDDLVALWRVMGAVYIIGTRGTENPLTEKSRKDSVAGARSAKPRIEHRDQINEVVARHCAALWEKNAKLATTKKGTAAAILAEVNSDLAKLGIEPLTEEALRKRIHLQNWRLGHPAS